MSLDDFDGLMKNAESVDRLDIDFGGGRRYYSIEPLPDDDEENDAKISSYDAHQANLKRQGIQTDYN
ncbi:MAG: hypothetical protein ACI83O_000271 [Patescibacteria group bacterium]|jgi:hypothetical protein